MRVPKGTYRRTVLRKGSGPKRVLRALRVA